MPTWRVVLRAVAAFVLGTAAIFLINGLVDAMGVLPPPGARSSAAQVAGFHAQLFVAGVAGAFVASSVAQRRHGLVVAVCGVLWAINDALIVTLGPLGALPLAEKLAVLGMVPVQMLAGHRLAGAVWRHK